ncbi:flagellar hook-associated protein 3 [Pseudomonas sp. FSL R10-0056]|uniref:flagellar hook-associated protein 3 n=1 Tax=unclassified Pseudomonas TaxID=196821 RepID=UPI001297CFFD|nr:MULTISPECIES: flagellar hook-associated protein 3 [unclassified Pseudomonas]MDN5392722.1 flagellar hook-associated protein 3 [Pseudomonas sp.]MDN5407195.1 flagellar hook-associated protein 3 [Pseudomonas sp.]MDN5454313.1 flagellar hook-associated protein 3 [Pseudomonas sp.]MDN5459370.1 flagellar hook-associated protein 3 [Pseudomonas sp.]MDN5673279.1 flagellar hook-associated protein 3 [Pseudomonas sp.]
MRISTSQFFESTSATYQNNFSSVIKTQSQIDSGVRIQTAADDPVGAARLLQLQQQKDMLAQYSTNMNSIKSSLGAQEAVLDSINNSLQKASELALRAGGGISDADRGAIANELGSIEEQVFSLLNSKDASGSYMFSGSKTDTPPYTRNNDGTYSYQGDDTQLNLKVSDTLALASSDTARSIMEGATNTGRTQATFVPGVDANGEPTVNDGKLSVSAGLVTSSAVFNKSFAEGQPYTLKFSSSTEYTLTDRDGNDLTSQVAGNGVFDPTKDGSQSISLRGVSFDITPNLKDVPAAERDAFVAGRSFTLEAKADTINASRTPGNSSTAQLTESTVTDAGVYGDSFPSNGAVIKFTSATEYEVYAQPLSADSKSIAQGTVDGGALGIKFDFAGAPQAGDQFVVNRNNHQSQNALDTISQLRKALEIPSDKDPLAQQTQKDAINSAIGNLKNASAGVDSARGSIGARLKAVDIQADENISLGLANDSTTAAIGNTDMAGASIELAFQKAMLEASQLAFVKISQLSLFNQL